MARKKAAEKADPTPDSKADSKSARTRERILDAAAHVLSVKGYAGTRLTDVAEYAALQAPAIYYYFASREDLIEEVMWVGSANMRTQIQTMLDALPSDLTPMDRILAAVEHHLRYELQISDYTTAAIRNAGQVPEQIRSRQLEEESKYGAIWRELIQAAADAGQVRSELDKHAARMFVVGALNWAAEWWTPRWGSLDTVVETAKSMVRHGLGTTDSELSVPGASTRTATASRRAGTRRAVTTAESV
ncbi:TetR/AcrR family transcriptional regulator [Rhodococcus chondri]|uniref:TetR/AcrR family transcriptional regulator n=1 Tax=Rhodococcus chondri TaxID=3065941 RepID=A0ABU7JUQ6_9NOCA|nr:TetR/AcrR family transcriptional regulator [Rhodococcus sp. CC-R104]MEE2033027.1 TetR/AcrR family transcriptional regulator [Rhodococcus sp. CC-R104]